VLSDDIKEQVGEMANDTQERNPDDLMIRSLQFAIVLNPSPCKCPTKESNSRREAKKLAYFLKLHKYNLGVLF
jgi:hypothetical protein